MSRMDERCDDFISDGGLSGEMGLERIQRFGWRDWGGTKNEVPTGVLFDPSTLRMVTTDPMLRLSTNEGSPHRNRDWNHITCKVKARKGSKKLPSCRRSVTTPR